MAIAEFSRTALALGLVLLASAARPEDRPAVVAVVLDTSGSLAASDLARARDLGAGLTSALPPGSAVAVLTFDDQSRVTLPATSDPAAVRAAIQKARRQGRYTALHDALFDASRYLSGAAGQRRAILLLTDGRDENSALNLDDGLKVAQEQGIPVFAVGLGRVDERVLRRIAKLTGGEYYPGAEARVPVLAQKVNAIAPRAATAAPSAVSSGSAPVSASPGRAVSGPAAAPAAPTTPAPARSASPAPSPASSRPGVLPLVVGVLVALAVLVLAALMLKGRDASRAGPILAAPLASSAPAASVSGALESSHTLPPVRRPLSMNDVSPTVVERMGITEEYLEKTVTLRARPVLVVTRGPGTGQVFELGLQASTSVGRAKANDVVLPDVAVSSQHFRIRPEEGRFVLHDLKSTNGTWVNDQKVSRHPLNEGDVIKAGETWLQFKTEQRI